MMLAAKKLRRNAERAHAHHNKHKHKKGMLGTLVAYRPWHRRQHNKAVLPANEATPASTNTDAPSDCAEYPGQPATREDSIVDGLKRLTERLQHLGLRTIPSEDDGNCQFRSLSQELYGTTRIDCAACIGNVYSTQRQ